jgi:hypothetical protein
MDRPPFTFDEILEWVKEYDKQNKEEKETKKKERSKK